MTNALTAVRDCIETALKAAGLHAFAIVPEVFTPPAVVIDGDEPYLSYEGAAFGAVLVHHRLTVIAAEGVNEVTAEQLDQLLIDVLLALPEEHVVEDVGRPGSTSVNGQPHPAVYVHCTTEIELTPDPPDPQGE